ncbi:DotD/TraH family lipoprotein [Neptuniibacter sp. QD37_11]|uniref:DotD/TraH family lipoprotein n=1 Tax=Neptuniibacter sp. QD37_11 TaxID=3398209 RepID=UPI0039F455F0
MRKQFKAIVLGSVVASTGLLAGCQSAQTKTVVPVEKIQTVNAKWKDVLTEVSIEVRDEVRLNAKHQQAMSENGMSNARHKQQLRKATVVPDDFKHRIDFDYVGKASEAAKALALAVNYELNIEGNPVGKEPWVNIKVDDEPVNEVVKELGIQTGDSARLEIYPSAKLMIFKYTNPNN